MKVTLEGTVSSGFGEGKFFTQLDWVVEQFQKKLGFVPFPGTLNLDIGEGDLRSLVMFVKDGGITIEPTDQAYCSALCFAAVVNGTVQGAVVIPEVTKHPAGRLEILAPVSIKETLKIKDGDIISLTLKK